MSSQAVSWVFAQSAPTKSELLIALAIADHAYPSGIAFPGQDVLADMCNCKTQTIIEMMKGLRSKGVIATVERRQAARSGRRSYKTSDWIVLGPRVSIEARLPMRQPSGQEDYPDAVLALLEVPQSDRSPRVFGGDQSDRSPRVFGGSHLGFSEVLTSGFPRALNKSAVEPNEEPKENPKKEQALSSREDLVGLSSRLADGIRGNDPKAKLSPSSKGWLEPLRLLVDVDGRSVREVEQVVDWCQADSFWKTNILSPGKLRAQFTALVLRMGEAGGGFEPEGLNFGFRSEPVGVLPEVSATRRVGPPVLPELQSWLVEHPSLGPLRAELERTLGPVEDQLSAAEFEVFGPWLSMLHVHEVAQGLLTVGCDHRGQDRWVRERFGGTLRGLAGMPVRVVDCGCSSLVEEAA